MMHVVDNWVLCLTSLLIWDAPEVKHLHIPECCGNANSKGVNLKEWLLELVGEQVPVLLSKGSSAQLVLEADIANKEGVNANDQEDECMTSPFTLLVDPNEQRRKECKLHVSGDCPTPEKASVVRCLEVWVDIADHQ